MKFNIFFIISFVLLFAGCAVESEETDRDPAGALWLIEDGASEIHVYGYHEVDEQFVLIVFRGFMNDEDIWLATVHKEDTGGLVKDPIHQMNGPFEGSSDLHTVVVDEDDGYEVGYIKSGALVPEELALIEIDGIDDWKIWIKQYAEDL